ncbi:MULTISPECIES: hypothetical protein [Burkholderia]|uniref:hypothetical protein n=1 Tax=Burkholderia TaxID=32008 RepID=UPI0012BCB1A9|nr:MULTISPECIES: hypothetical protein [Burkholderia]
MDIGASALRFAREDDAAVSSEVTGSPLFRYDERPAGSPPGDMPVTRLNARLNAAGDA